MSWQENKWRPLINGLLFSLLLRWLAPDFLRYHVFPLDPPRMPPRRFYLPSVWSISKPEVVQELFGVWEVEEYWVEDMPMISRRVKVPWEAHREFLVFQPDRFSIISYSSNKDHWELCELCTPAYGIEKKEIFYINYTVPEAFKRPLELDRNMIEKRMWSIEGGQLFFYERNGHFRDLPEKVPQRPIPGKWRMAKRVDAKNDELGVCQIDPASLPPRAYASMSIQNMSRDGRLHRERHSDLQRGEAAKGGERGE